MTSCLPDPSRHCGRVRDDRLGPNIAWAIQYGCLDFAFVKKYDIVSAELRAFFGKIPFITFVLLLSHLSAQ